MRFRGAARHYLLHQSGEKTNIFSNVERWIDIPWEGKGFDCMWKRARRVNSRCHRISWNYWYSFFRSKRDAFARNIVSMQRFKGPISRLSIWVNWPCGWTKKNENKCAKVKMVQNRECDRIIKKNSILLSPSPSPYLTVSLSHSLNLTLSFSIQWRL